MSDKVINSVTKIPLLGDIPILGFFFRSTTKHIVKTNLIIALTPYVINDQSDLRRVLEKKMKERREFVERFGGEERPSLEANIDYRRKRGMLEEINRAAREIEREEKELRHDPRAARSAWTSRGRSSLPVRAGQRRSRRRRGAGARPAGRDAPRAGAGAARARAAPRRPSPRSP